VQRAVENESDHHARATRSPHGHAFEQNLQANLS